MAHPVNLLRTEDIDLQFEGYVLEARKLILVEEAERPVLVFLHDSLGCITLWRDFPLQLAQRIGCNVLIYDRRGYGQSSPFGEQPRTLTYLEEEADVVAEILEKCGITRAVLYGHSDGGSIALVAAARYPRLITAVITEGAHVFVEEVTLAGIREAVETYRTTSLAEKLQKYHGDKTEAVFMAWTQTWLAPAFRNWNIEKYLPQIRCPVLVIQGEDDEYGTEEQVKAIGRQVAGSSKMCMVKGAAHSPWKQAAAVVLHESATFLNEVMRLRG